MFEEPWEVAHPQEVVSLFVSEENTSVFILPLLLPWLSYTAFAVNKETLLKQKKTQHMWLFCKEKFAVLCIWV